MRPKAIVSLSGGLDSTTVLAEALFHGYDVLCVAFRYGSKHNAVENKAAEQIANYYKCPFEIIDFTSVAQGFRSNLLLGQGAIPEGHYEDASMALTVVPARNIIFAAILAGVAWSQHADSIWLGIHQGDHAIYPDCRPEFFWAMDIAVRLGTDKRVVLKAPYLESNKTAIVRRGTELGVPYQLTRTCYQESILACGKCGSCTERLEAFRNNGLEDPIPYENTPK